MMQVQCLGCNNCVIHFKLHFYNTNPNSYANTCPSPSPSTGGDGGDMTPDEQEEKARLIAQVERGWGGAVQLMVVGV